MSYKGGARVLTLILGRVHVKDKDYFVLLGIVDQGFSGTLGLWDSGTLGLWDSGTLGLWDSPKTPAGDFWIVRGWDSGTLGLTQNSSAWILLLTTYTLILNLFLLYKKLLCSAALPPLLVSVR